MTVADLNTYCEANGLDINETRIGLLLDGGDVEILNRIDGHDDEEEILVLN